LAKLTTENAHETRLFPSHGERAHPVATRRHLPGLEGAERGSLYEEVATAMVMPRENAGRAPPNARLSPAQATREGRMPFAADADTGDPDQRARRPSEAARLPWDA
jgi:hypothetical protein